MMVHLPISLELIEIIIDEVFSVVQAQTEIEDCCPEVTLNAAWFKLHGIEKILEEAEYLMMDRKVMPEFVKIKDTLSKALLELEIMGEQEIFDKGEPL